MKVWKKLKQMVCRHPRYYAVGDLIDSETKGFKRKRYIMRCQCCGKEWIK